MSIVKRRLIDLSIYASILMIVLGALLGGKPVVTFGWTLLLVGAGLKIFLNIAGGWLQRRMRWWPLIPVLIVALGVGVEGFLLMGGAVRWAAIFALGAAAGLAVAGMARPKGAAERALLPIVLALLLALGCLGVGAYQLSDHTVVKLCRQSDWERSALGHLGAKCPAR